MGTLAGDQPGRHTLADGQIGPTVPRMVLGVLMRRLRETRNITRKEAGEAIRASDSKISRMELGRVGFKLRDVIDLCVLYQVTDQVERATLLGLARQANIPGWWSGYGEVIPGWFQAYLGLEQAASVIRCYEVQFVPGLLQTQDYALGVIRLGHGDAPRPEVELRLELRMRRQQILFRHRPPHVWAIIDEAALRRPIGGSATMFHQLQHLIDVCDLPHVTVQVLPFDAGGHDAAGGPITLLRMPEPDLPDVVYLEQLTTALYPDRPDDVLYYRHIMNRLATTRAAPATATSTILRRIIREM
jgi:hypothetical protein